jgi:cation transport ATPase
MDTGAGARTPVRETPGVGHTDPNPRDRSLALSSGGTDGNEQLTATTGVMLIVLLAVIGVTIPLIGQLTWLHLFMGLLLIGPVALKMASTGYRFMRYYIFDDAYRRKGPPELVMRLLAPVVVVSTVVMFASGVVLLFEGPARRAQWLLIHKVSFIVWIAFTALHVLGHLLELPASLRAAGSNTELGRVTPGSAGRWIALAGAVVGGLVLAIVLIPHFATWTAHGALHHHHEG